MCHMRVRALSYLYLTIRFYIYNCIQRFILQIYVFPYLMRSDCMIICVRYDTYTLHNYICIAVNLVDQENCHEMVTIFPLKCTVSFAGNSDFSFQEKDVNSSFGDINENYTRQNLQKLKYIYCILRRL